MTVKEMSEAIGNYCDSSCAREIALANCMNL
jgi:hypothetical protein